MHGFRSRLVCLVLPLLLVGASARAIVCLEWWCDPAAPVDHARMHAATGATADMAAEPSCHGATASREEAVKATSLMACDDLFAALNARIVLSQSRPDAVVSPAILPTTIDGSGPAALPRTVRRLAVSHGPPGLSAGTPLVLRI